MIKGGSHSELLFILNDFAANVIGISSGKRYAKEKGREATRNSLLLFTVSRLRIPKIPEF